MGAVFNRVTLSATGQTVLARAGANVGEAGWELNFAGSSWTGSIVLKQNTAPPGSAVSLSSVSYFNATTGALVAAGTAITAGGSVVVPWTGLDLYADYTHTAGSVQITCMAGAGQFGGLSVAAADVTAGTFGAYTGETGTYTFPGALTAVGAVTGAAASFTTGAFSSTVSGTIFNSTSTGYRIGGNDILYKNGTSLEVYALDGSRVAFIIEGTATDTTRYRADTHVIESAVGVTLASISTTAANFVGDFSVATTKFTVAAATGNTVVAGTLGISGVTSHYGAVAVPATAGAAAAGAPVVLYSGLLTIEATSDAPTHTRPKGSLCINTGGSSTTTRLYVNTDGAGTWTPFTTSA